MNSIALKTPSGRRSGRVTEVGIHDDHDIGTGESGGLEHIFRPRFPSQVTRRTLATSTHVVTRSTVPSAEPPSPRGERALTQQQFEASVASRLAELPGTRMRFGADGESGAKVQITLRSDDADMPSRTVAAVTREMQAMQGFQNAGSTASLARPEMQLTPQPDKAATLGISTETIAQTATSRPSATPIRTCRSSTSRTARFPSASCSTRVRGPISHGY